MLNTIYADSNVGIASLFGRPSQALQARINQGVQDFLARTTPYCSNLAASVADRFHNYTQGDFARRVNSVRGYINQNFKSDSVRYLTDVEDIQNAPAAMRHYVMAHPGMRSLYQENRIEGYGEHYVDASPTGVGRTHYDYRVITNGVAQLEETENGENRMVARRFFEAVKPDYTPNISDKSAVQLTYQVLSSHLRDSLLDPSSENNALIG